MEIDACKRCGKKVTECHCIEPGALHRRNPKDSTGRMSHYSQPVKCLYCRKILGADCNHGREIFKHKDRFAIVECAEYDPLYPINGKKKC